MQKPTQIQKYLYRGYYQDGLWDIWLGICLIILGIGFYYFQQVEGPVGEMLAVFGFIALVFITFRGLAKVLAWAKKTYTHPRSGYVKFKPRDRKKSRKGIIIRVGVVMLLITLINVISSLYVGELLVDLFRWTIISGALAAAMVWLGTQFEIKRYYITAGLLFISGIITAFLVNADQQIILFYFLVGGIMIVIGSGTLIHFLRTTKPAEDAAFEEGDDYE